MTHTAHNHPSPDHPSTLTRMDYCDHEGSVASSVESWLDAHPATTTEYECAFNPILRVGCKRRKTHQERLPKKFCTMAPRKDFKKTTKTPIRQSTRIQKHSARIQKQPSRAEASTPQRAPPIIAADDGPIPKASSIGFVPNLFPRAQLSRPPSPGRSSNTSGTSGTRSPVKQMADFEFSNAPVEYQSLELYDVTDTDAGKLLGDLRDIADQEGIIPGMIKDFEDAQAMITRRQLRTKHFGEHEQLDERGLTHQEFWSRAKDVLRSGYICQNENLAEPSWNDDVHSTVLNLALRGRWNEVGIHARNVTKACISDLSLLPTVASGAALSSKMVDYALVLGRDVPGLRSSIVAKLQAEGAESITHSSAEYLRLSPIAVSIETKRALVDEDKAKIQLAVWLSAHFARLRQLTTASIPAQPVLRVHGHQWILMIAEEVENTRIRVLESLPIGSTESMVGIYQLVKSLRRVAMWIEGVYLLWFQEKALKIEE